MVFSISIVQVSPLSRDDFKRFSLKENNLFVSATLLGIRILINMINSAKKINKVLTFGYNRDIIKKMKERNKLIMRTIFTINSENNENSFCDSIITGFDFCDRKYVNGILDLDIKH